MYFGLMSFNGDKRIRVSRRKKKLRVRPIFNLPLDSARPTHPDSEETSQSRSFYDLHLG